MQKLIATFEIVTPMFLGGADQMTVSRIRESSIKGVLAFWWRTMEYPRALKQAKGDHAAALKQLQAREQKLFGGPDGQGAFLLKITRHPTKKLQPNQPLKSANGKTVGEGARYLGYGLVEAFGNNGGNLKRSAFEDRQQFELSIAFKPQHSKEHKSLFEELIAALKFMGLIGGLGSRVRRGWGSLALVGLEGAEFEPATSIQAYKSQLQAILGSVPRPDATSLPLTAISQGTRIMIANGALSQDSLTSLDHIGRQMQRFRAWGFSGRNSNGPPTVNGAPSEMNFRDDHHWSKKDSNLPPTFVPRRIAFGLPQNYKDNDGVTGTGGIDRRGSPLFIHIHRLPDGQAFPVLCLLPAQFLPTSKVSANRKQKDYDFFKDGMPVLNHFLSSARPDPNAKDPFRHGPYLDIDEISLGMDK